MMFVHQFLRTYRTPDLKLLDQCFTC